MFVIGVFVLIIYLFWFCGFLNTKFYQNFYKGQCIINKGKTVYKGISYNGIKYLKIFQIVLYGYFI